MYHKHQNKRDKGCEFYATQRKKKKKKKPRNKSNFLFDNFSYRAESAPRSELAGWRKSMLEPKIEPLRLGFSAFRLTTWLIVHMEIESYRLNFHKQVL